ncbi:MMPL family transporter [uncultured Gulosibacter sp.]|uniref:MMPL family transporter n=1 Tax=uncultured Gulosibacter sp. TaxID=1339167 RepID=UPI00288AA86E|nr:MMPL family transporter [uncultured Gulosibacter sp.]
MQTTVVTLARHALGRRGAWIALGSLMLMIALLFALFASAPAAARADHAADNAESTRAAELLAGFPDADSQSVLIVAERGDQHELTAADIDRLAALPLPQTADTVGGPIVSQDRQAALLVHTITTGDTSSDTAETISALRQTLADADVPGMTLYVTGGPAFGADIAASFDGADFTLLLVTVCIVAGLLIITYRSPILWLVPLAVVAVADGLAGRVTAALAEWLGLNFDAGIISVLVFGAGANYALLLISRYRDQLRHEPDHRAALATAWRASLGAIVASNLTVVLSLLTLVFAVIPGTRGLGVAAAAGLLIAAAAVLLVLPPALAVCGRGVFWPVTPRPDREPARVNIWQRMATGVSRRAAASLVSGLALLAVLAAGFIGTSVGLDQLAKFRVQSESATGLKVLSEHFPAGEAQPIQVVAQTRDTDAVVAAAIDVPGVLRAHPSGTAADGALTRISVTSEYSPSSPESLEQIPELRSALSQAAEGEVLVGGAVATDYDSRAGNVRDFALLVPMIIAVSLLVLAALTRSMLAPILLIAVNIASAVAAIGAGSWLSRMLLGQPALDVQVPLLAFLFLVSLGIDYTIFLVHRAQSEARTLGTRDGMVAAVAQTGGVITSAGIVLAAVFAALGVLPLVTLGQLGLIVGVGVIVDTLVVRTVIVPALFALLGDRIWWPRKPSSALANEPVSQKTEHATPNVNSQLAAARE